MNIDRVVLAFAGTMVLASITLAHLYSPYWLLLTAFVGLNMLQAAFTGFCPLAIVLRRIGVPAGCAFPQETGAMNGQVKMVEPATVLDWYNSGSVTVIDVRERGEYQAGHVPGALLVPLSAFDPQRVPIDPAKTLVFHCQSGRRCGPAAAKMLAHGFTGQINRLHGGFNAWVGAGGPVDKGA